MASARRSTPNRTASRLLSALAVVTAGVATVVVLFPNPLADVFVAGWMLLGVGFALVGVLGAWTNRTPLVWVAAFLSAGLAIAGMWTVGFLIAPAAGCLFGAALFSQLVGPRPGVREDVIANPPTVQQAGLKALAGVGSVLVGGWLAYDAAVTRGLFEACANETLACTVENTHWNAVGVTVLGLVGISLGGWVVWKQVYNVRELASTQGE